jgi:hypothetical protein
MFVALSLQFLGLAIASLPTQLRQQDGVILLSAAWIAICLAVTAAFIVVLPAHGLTWVGWDRLEYEAYYAGAVDGYSPDTEIAFSLLTDFVAALSANSSIFFLIVFFGTVAMFHALVAYLFRLEDQIAVYFCYFNYFSFFAGTLNTIRQTLGIALFCIAIVYFLQDRLRSSCLLIVLASLIHSVCILSFVIFLARIPGATVWRLVAAVLAVFAMSLAGVTQTAFDGFINLTGIYPKHLIEYTSGEWAWREYSGGNYRVDFLVFSLLPLIPYAFFWWRADNYKALPAWVQYEKLMKLYITLIMPFAFFSYMMFSDRYSSLSWFILPILVIWPLLYMEKTPSRRMWAIRTILLTVVAIVPNAISYEATLMRICWEIL